MTASLGYLAALLGTNLRAGFARPGPALAAFVFMFLNNFIFFVIWFLYFERFPSLAGWQREDVALLYGVVAWAYGLAVACAGGVRDIGRSIVDGSLDVHLGRPRHPLPSLLFSRSTPSGFGDLASAPVLWLWLAGRGIADLPLLVLLATAAAGVLLATTTIAQSAVFWWPRAVKLGEQVYEVIVMVSVYPQHVFGPTVRLALFTVFPVAFISQVPVEAVREASPAKALAVVAAAVLYGGLAVLVFERGLRGYTSGNRMVENR